MTWIYDEYFQKCGRGVDKRAREYYNKVYHRIYITFTYKEENEAFFSGSRERWA